MDQGGLKRSGNRDGCLTFGEAGGRLGGDPAGSLLQPAPAVHLPGLGSLPPTTVSSAGQGGSQNHLEFGGFFPSDTKGKAGMQKQQDVDLFSLEAPDSTSIITTSDTSVLGNFPLPDLFPQHIKQEETFSLEKDLKTYGLNAAVGPGDLDSTSNQLLDDDTAIWKDLDLPCSLPEISDFELDTEVAHLDNILHECRSGGAPVGAFPKDIKPGSDDGMNCLNLNGTKHPVQHLSQQLQPQPQPLPLQLPLQPGPLLSSIMIKEEKDPDLSFVHIQTPGVVKQEKGSGDPFCQTLCLQSGISSGHGGGAMASLPMGVSPRPGYDYRANPASAVGLQDQKPFCSYPTLPVSGESWSAGGRYGDSAGLPRADDGLPSTTVLGTFPSSFSR